MAEAALDITGAFATVVDVLRSLGVSHAFIGALPVLAWGRVRATTDIDLVVATTPENLQILDQALRSRGLMPGRSVGPATADDPTPDIAVYWCGQTRIDLFVAKTPFEHAAIATARKKAVLGLEVSLASPEASIVYKLIASRHRDIDDVESIFEARQAAGDLLDWEFLEHWAREWELEERLAPYRDRYCRDPG